MIADFHNDFITSDNYREVLTKYKNAENIVVAAVYKGRRSFEECFALASIINAEKCDKIRLAFEDFSFDENPETLERLLDLDPFYVTLTWNGDCNLGGGAGSLSGLTQKGRDVIRLLNERNVFVDLAHLGVNSFYEALSLADKVVCSHTAFSSVNEHKRNLSDDQLEALNGRGVKIGLAFYPYFLNGTARADVSDVFRHIDYFVGRFGADNLCIGTDFYGCEVYPEGMEDYSFERLLTEKLYAAGYTEDAVNKILYNNLCGIIP